MGYKNILFIDDDADDLELVVSALSNISGDFKYETLNSGLKALQKLESKEVDPDLIFLDLNMPIMSGQQFLSELKNREALKHIPVIILSTSSNPTAVKETADLGAVDFLTKPASFSALITMMQRVLG